MCRLPILLPLPAAAPAGSRSLKAPSLKTTANAMRAVNSFQKIGICAMVFPVGGSKPASRRGSRPSEGRTRIFPVLWRIRHGWNTTRRFIDYLLFSAMNGAKVIHIPAGGRIRFTFWRASLFSTSQSASGINDTSANELELVLAT